MFEQLGLYLFLTQSHESVKDAISSHHPFKIEIFNHLNKFLPWWLHFYEKMREINVFLASVACVQISAAQNV